MGRFCRRIDRYRIVNLIQRQASLEEIQTAIDDGADINAIKDIYTPLILSIRNGPFQLTELLIRNHADINLKSREGKAPLHYAAEYDSDAVNLLILKGAQIDIKDNNGQTPLFIAASDNNATTLESLLDAEADPNEVDNNGNTLFDVAGRAGSDDNNWDEYTDYTIQRLCDYGLFHPACGNQENMNNLVRRATEQARIQQIRERNIGEKIIPRTILKNESSGERIPTHNFLSFNNIEEGDEMVNINNLSKYQMYFKRSTYNQMKKNNPVTRKPITKINRYRARFPNTRKNV